MKKTHFLKVLLFGIAIIAFVLVSSGWVSLWITGIAVIGNDVKNYHLQSYPVDGEYTVKIDLMDLGSNVGKVLYNDGENKIYVEKVLARDKSDYQVYFRSSGTYSVREATLVSGLEHAITENGFTTRNHVNATATYRRDSFKIYPSGSSGLNYKDGDSFGYYLFPHDKVIDVDIEKDSFIEVKLSNLTMNKWKKK
ncbi:hypothetical protein [Bacillus sp. JJ722]|uniref:hypothetical protein n=1 Tax=Bacillus sp. JJ722 TaxID=3122973 RepID=UPI002FFDB8CD